MGYEKWYHRSIFINMEDVHNMYSVYIYRVYILNCILYIIK